MLRIEEKEGLHSFRHEAMATDLVVSIGGVDSAYARQVAQAFFARVDEVESKLSLYQESSDVTRINLLKSGEQTRVSEECIECLSLAMLASDWTGGRFHPFLGVEALKAKGKVPGYLQPILGLGDGDVGSATVQIDPQTRQLVKMSEGVLLDLGGIGKGYALDVAMEEIEDWEVPEVMANFGGSTLLFQGEEGGDRWEGRLNGVALAPFFAGAFSSSGVGFQGEHIVSVEGDGLLWERSFARAASAALADALTTGAMLMKEEDLFSLSEAKPEVALAASLGESYWGVERFCCWPEL